MLFVVILSTICQESRVQRPREQSSKAKRAEFKGQESRVQVALKHM